MTSVGSRTAVDVVTVGWAKRSVSITPMMGTLRFAHPTYTCAMATERDKNLREKVERQAKRMKKAERERPTLFAQTITIGTLGLVFVLPVVAGAYLGHWLDGLAVDYSTRWTLSLIFVGLVVGAFNVYLLIRE